MRVTCNMSWDGEVIKVAWTREEFEEFRTRADNDYLSHLCDIARRQYYYIANLL